MGFLSHRINQYPGSLSTQNAPCRRPPDQCTPGPPSDHPRISGPMGACCALDAGVPRTNRPRLALAPWWRWLPGGGGQTHPHPSTPPSQVPKT